jgi:hypothetical protein
MYYIIKDSVGSDFFVIVGLFTNEVLHICLGFFFNLIDFGFVTLVDFELKVAFKEELDFLRLQLKCNTTLK